MKKLTAIMLALMLVLSLAACGSTTAGSDASAPEPAGTEEAAQPAVPAESEEAETPDEPAESEETEPEIEATVFEGADVNIAVLTGPTGIGAVGLMEANDAGETVNNYNFTVTAANDDIVAGLASGEFDIAAIATNVASTLYNKTSGAIQLCALNTYGVLYILENGESINSIQDLAGKTIYATGQGANPEYVLKYLLDQNSLTYDDDGTVSDADVTIEYLDSETLVAGTASGEYEIAMLPVPAVTSVMVQNPDVRIALDLTEEWNSVTDEGVLTMGSIVVRTEFAQEHPEAVDTFLSEYANSIDYVQGDVEGAAALCETYGIVAKAAVAAKAIPNCNLCCITGADIRPAIEPYYNVLFNFNPAAIGGELPGDDFYYAPATLPLGTATIQVDG